ncbi:MAG: poly-gamma-glutamate synthase PgsB [Candidatus Marinimicrobia bacterium]|jgi:poly-gamma-glutamate synthase PgsB/CapB|nr:poly-gamma-glutamate synthase PgsB [Candidatus Neomarinimicrobiota bacterium]MBT4129944.1 poly-gamma-glutamate synthase PgsB [Candidatus Neomarinimicrobiota bacterium]MBT4992692.1 poly-gamma-glutamate synthase PgsB [Candidatus Neomarinimicrobiota bacterium]MBT5466390.1 poly-gamma-glutamate synthase PgsB [Candidatus Neomarinimicrobiota bacterium]MBT6946520.1 poly-gamma-glutamate synthase PgsB [Candidatus Neomarinimicrobiota bacterium]
MDVVVFSLFIMILTVIAALTGEWWVHVRALKRIPIRIHVNGTRGKSSVTRLICAGLREAGFSVLGKTTGTDPRILDLEGKDRKIHRLQKPSIGEQVRFLRYFSQLRPRAIILECMAVQPQYQWITEQHMVKSTHSVITNARLDHVEEMGHRLRDIAMSLSNTIPFKGTLFTAEQDKLDIFKEVAAKRGTEVNAVTDHGVSHDDMIGFNHIEHPENVALSIAVCESLGVPREQALDGMRKAQPDPGALRIWDLEVDGRHFSLVNAFAANDPQSTKTIWNMIKEHPSLDHEHTCAFLNTRSDRVSRTSQLLELILKDIKPDSLFVRGDKMERFEKPYFSKVNGSVEQFSENEDAAVFAKKLLSQKGNTLIFGIGNIVGSGFQILDELKKYRIHK